MDEIGQEAIFAARLADARRDPRVGENAASAMPAPSTHARRIGTGPMACAMKPVLIMTPTPIILATTRPAPDQMVCRAMFPSFFSGSTRLRPARSAATVFMRSAGTTGCEHARDGRCRAYDGRSTAPELRSSDLDRGDKVTMASNKCGPRRCQMGCGNDPDTGPFGVAGVVGYRAGKADILYKLFGEIINAEERRPDVINYAIGRTTSYALYGQDPLATQSRLSRRHRRLLRRPGFGRRRGGFQYQTLEVHGWRGICVDPFPSNMEHRSCRMFKEVVDSEGGPHRALPAARAVFPAASSTTPDGGSTPRPANTRWN